MTNPESPRLSWFNVGFHLTAAVEYQLWREAPWLPVVITDGDVPGRVRAYQLTEAPHLERLESAVRQWLKDETLPSLEHPVSFLLVLRFAVVGNLLSSFEGVLPPVTEQSLNSIYERFLLDWWRRSGPGYAVGFTCSDYDIEAK